MLTCWITRRRDWYPSPHLDGTTAGTLNPTFPSPRSAAPKTASRHRHLHEVVQASWRGDHDINPLPQCLLLFPLGHAPVAAHRRDALWLPGSHKHLCDLHRQLPAVRSELACRFSSETAADAGRVSEWMGPLKRRIHRIPSQGDPLSVPGSMAPVMRTALVCRLARCLPGGEGGEAEHDGAHLVGERQSTMGPFPETTPSLRCFLRWASAGRPNARVFPEPVAAMPTRSRPDRMTGQHMDWMGDGRSNDAVHLRRPLENPHWSKRVTGRSSQFSRVALRGGREERHVEGGAYGDYCVGGKMGRDTLREGVRGFSTEEMCRGERNEKESLLAYSRLLVGSGCQEGANDTVAEDVAKTPGQQQGSAHRTAVRML